MNIVLDQNNIPVFTADAKATMVELALAEHEKNGRLPDDQRKIFLSAGMSCLDQMENTLRCILARGEAEPFNGDGAIESSADFRKACLDRFTAGQTRPYLFGKRNIAETRTVLIG